MADHSMYYGMQDPTLRWVSPTRASSPMSPGGLSPSRLPHGYAVSVSPDRRGPAEPPKLLRTAKNVGGTVQIRIFRIEGFADKKSMVDTIDPFVRVTYESTQMQTTVKPNAGGNVTFDETLSFSKRKDRHIIQVDLLDSETFRFNQSLAGREIDLSKLPLEDWSEFIENAKPVAFELKDDSGKVAGRVFLGFAACTIQIKIFHIENFPDNTGLMGMDKTDPCVRLTYGDKAFKTKTAQNAGGNATFEEIAEFERDPKINTLKVEVLESDAGGLHHDLLGSREIDLTKQFYSETLDGTAWIQAFMLDLIMDGKVQGAIKLAFCKIPHVRVGKDSTLYENARLGQPPAPSQEKQGTSFTGAVHIKVFQIEGFADSAGMMDKTDPYVSMTMGKSTKKTDTKNNAGGNARFDQVLTFHKDRETVSMKVVVKDSDTFSDDTLGEREVDLTRQVYVEDLENATHGKPFDVLDKQGKVAGTVYLAFSACVIHCHVVDIHGFSNTAGFMDKTDPFVRLSIGNKKLSTAVKDNAGGTVTFDQTLSFDKPPGEHFLKIAVMDRDTVSDDVLGERDVDLRKQYFWPSAESGQPIAVEVYKNGQIAGTVNLCFAKSPKRPGQASVPKGTQPATRWVPSKGGPEVTVTPVVTKRNRCDDTCSCCSFFCCCCEETVVPRAAVVDKQAEGRMPDGFREVGYRVNLQGKWTKQSLAGEETHHLDIKAGDDSLNIGANVEMPVHYNVRAPPVARGSPLPVNMRASPMATGSPLPATYLASPQQRNSMMMGSPQAGHFSPALRYGI